MTDKTTTTDAPPADQLPDAVDADRVALDRERYGEYRSLMRLSPSNEAQSCATVADVREAINKEMYRDNPRDWVVAGLNKRFAEVQDGD
jgi:hypothetical protein